MVGLKLGGYRVVVRRHDSEDEGKERANVVLKFLLCFEICMLLILLIVTIKDWLLPYETVFRIGGGRRLVLFAFGVVA